MMANTGDERDIDRECDLELWTGVKVVYRECLLKNGGHLPHVAQRLNAFVNGPPKWSLLETYELTASLHCMRLLSAHKRSAASEQLYRDWEFNEITTLTSSRGDLSALRWLAERYLPDGLLSAAANAAARSGNLQILQWLYGKQHNRVHWGYVEWSGAFRGDHENVIHWLMKHAVPHADMIHDALYGAAKAGYLDVMQWLLSKDESGAEAAVLGARRGHKWNIVKWLALHYNISSLSSCVSDAAKDGDLEFLRWMHPLVPYHAFSEAAGSSAAGGHLEVLKWLSELVNDLPLTAECMDQAASGGHLEVVKWLDMHKCSASTQAMDGAASGGFLEVVQWLHDNREDGCTTAAMNRAAENGHLEVVQWLHAMRTESCSVSAMEKAAGNGHLEVVRWLHLNRSEGCTKRAMDWAAQGGHLDVVKWLHANRPEGCTAAAMNCAAGNGHLEVIMWLHHNRSEGSTHRAMDLAAGGGQQDVLLWLHENQTKGFSPNAMDMAAAGGHLRILQWLHANGSEMPSPNAMRDATLFGHVPVMLFLYNEYGHEYSEVGICSLADAWEDLTIRSVRTAQWLLEVFGGRLDGVVLRVKRSDWATNKWLESQHLRQMEVEHKFVFWECGATTSSDHDN